MQPAGEALVRRRSVLGWAVGGLAGWPSYGSEAVRRRVEVRYEATVPEDAEGPVSLWMPVPVSDGYQRIEGLRIEGAKGQAGFFAKVKAGQRVTMTFRVTRRERKLEAGPSVARPDCCLHADRLVPVDGRIREWAKEVVRGAASDVEKARAIYEHVVDTVKYDKSGRGWGRGDIYYACDARRGNCTDFHAIFIGYARAVGVPAKFVIGLPFPRERGAGEVAGYHCWAEFFADGMGWVAVDASEAAKDPARRRYFFGAVDENRVQLSEGRDVMLTPRQAGAPLNYFVYPYAEAGGRPVEGLLSRVFYRDLPVA